MELYLTYHENYADEHIILPKQLKVTTIKTFTDPQKKPIQTTEEDNVRKAKQKMCKSLSEPIETNKIAQWMQNNVQKIENSFEFIVGEDKQKIYLGPVLRQVGPDNYVQLNAKSREVLFFEESAFKEKDKPTNRQKNQVYLLPAKGETDLLVLVVTNGTVLVKPGAALVVDMPVVMVKSTGEYFTVNNEMANKNNRFVLKDGIHFVFVVKIGSPVPIIFSRPPKAKIPETSAKRESMEKFLAEKTDQIHKSKVEVTSDDGGEPLGEFDIPVERIYCVDLSDLRFIPDFIIEWLHKKGYDIESGGGEALLGIGATSVVRRGTRLSDQRRFAIKVIVWKMDEINRNYGKAPRQLYVAKQVDHQNIIKCVDVFCVISEVPNRRDRMYSFIVMDMATSTNLERVLLSQGRYTESEAKMLFRQIVAAVVYLHSRRVAHLRIRAQNCLVMGDGSIKLCDFSRAEQIVANASDAKQNVTYSWKLMPPEFFDNAVKDLRKIDIWMCGCLLVVLLTGNISPFGDINRDDYYNRTKEFKAFRERQKSFPPDLQVSPPAVSLLQAMLETDPNKRIDAKTVAAHQWLK